MAQKVTWDNVTLGPVVLIKAGEDILGERARDSLVAQARAMDPEIDVERIDARTYSPGHLQMVMSPSLFGGGTIAVADHLKDMNDSFLEDALNYVTDPSPDTFLVLIHEGGNRGLKLTKAIHKAGFDTVTIDPLKRDADKAALLRADAKKAGRRIGDDALAALVDGLGSDVREMVSALAQLMSDVDGPITAETVKTYYSGRVEATGFAVADAAIAGREGHALHLLRHALATGTNEVPIVAALALKVRQLCLVLGAQGRGGQSGLKMAPWQIDRARRELSGWSSEGLAMAISAIARCDGEVKGFEGGSRDPQYSLERTIHEICVARRK